jgi:hypothetical protein
MLSTLRAILLRTTLQPILIVNVGKYSSKSIRWICFESLTSYVPLASSTCTLSRELSPGEVDLPRERQLVESRPTG